MRGVVGPPFELAAMLCGTLVLCDCVSWDWNRKGSNAGPSSGGGGTKNEPVLVEVEGASNEMSIFAACSACPCKRANRRKHSRNCTLQLQAWCFCLSSKIPPMRGKQSLFPATQHDSLSAPFYDMCWFYIRKNAFLRT